MSQTTTDRSGILSARLLGAALIGTILAAAPLAGGHPALAAKTPPPMAAEEPGQDKSQDEPDMNTLRERLRVLGEALRNAIEDATRAIKREEDPLAGGRGGLGDLAPPMEGRDVRAVYGPKGVTLRSVEALLNYRLVLLGNDRLTAGRVYERNKRIIAEVVTRKEQALVARYLIDPHSGMWIAER